MHFKQMKSGMTHIEKMIDSWENDEAQFSTQIETTVGEKKDYLIPGNFPLEKLQHMLEEWDKQDIWTKEELMEYAHELWKTVEAFEQELKNSATVYDLHIKKLKFSGSTRVEWIKHKTNYYIMALEEALLISKQK